MSTGCSKDSPSIEPLCADPAYRAAHPDECKNFAVLILMPEYAITESGKTVAYTVILRANAMEEILTLGLTFQSSNVGAAIIGPDGIATGVAAGSTTISVQWQDLSAHAQLDVVGSCQETNQHFAILIDNSKSMGQLFSASYATKLSFSKSIARDLCSTVNVSKDDFSVWKFADDSDQLYDGSDFGVDSDAARSAIQSITLSTEKTNMADALQEVIEAFPTTGVRVIVLFSDFEWTGTDPHAIAQAFKESGGFLVVVATRAWGDFFQDAAECSSGGFFLSAYDETEADISVTLAGLKSFLCSGSCSPEPGTAPHAALNYTGFINWDVTSGRVDLVGLGLYDILRPVGHTQGLFVDLQGTADSPLSPFGYGQMTSKEDFLFTAGQQFRFTISAAGSQYCSPVEDSPPDEFKIRVRCGDELDEIITISDCAQIMTPYPFTWTPTITHSGPIIIEQTRIGSTTHEVDPTLRGANVGTLIDDVLLQNLTLATTLFDDDFNSENPTTIEPSPGYGYGCLEQPPGAQTADPTPLARLVE